MSEFEAKGLEDKFREPKRPVTTSIPDQDYHKLTKLALDKNISIAELARQMIYHCLKF